MITVIWGQALLCRYPYKNLRVLVQQGYYELATLYGATQYFLDYMDLPEELRDNITAEYYEAGHMMYVHPEPMEKFSRTLAEFIH